MILPRQMRYLMHIDRAELDQAVGTYKPDFTSAIHQLAVLLRDQDLTPRNTATAAASRSSGTKARAASIR